MEHQERTVLMLHLIGRLEGVELGLMGGAHTHRRAGFAPIEHRKHCCAIEANLLSGHPGTVLGV